jgi:hypothetical protein
MNYHEEYKGVMEAICGVFLGQPSFGLQLGIRTLWYLIHLGPLYKLQTAVIQEFAVVRVTSLAMVIARGIVQ